jgi:hypothetical protein
MYTPGKQVYDCGPFIYLFLFIYETIVLFALQFVFIFIFGQGGVFLVVNISMEPTP